MVLAHMEAVSLQRRTWFSRKSETHSQTFDPRIDEDAHGTSRAEYQKSRLPFNRMPPTTFAKSDQLTARDGKAKEVDPEV